MDINVDMDDEMFDFLDDLPSFHSKGMVNIMKIGDFAENMNRTNSDCVEPVWKKITDSYNTGSELQSRHGHRAVAFENLMIIFGGGNYGIFDDLRVYDIKKNHWYSPRVQGEPPLGRASFGFVLLNSKIIMFGGMLEYGRYANDLFELNILKWEWKRMKLKPNRSKDPPCPRLGHSFTWLQDRVYLFGGLMNVTGDVKNNIPKYLNDLYTLQFVGNNGVIWETPQTYGRPPSSRESHTCVAYSKKDGSDPRLIIYGGMAGFRLGDVCILRTDTMTWEHPEMRTVPPKPRSLHTANVVGNKMYVFGGWVPIFGIDDRYMVRSKQTKWECSNDLAILNLDVMEWEKVITGFDCDDSIPDARAGHSSVVCNNKIFIWSGRDAYKISTENQQVCYDDLWIAELEKPSKRPGKINLMRATSKSLQLNWSSVPEADGYLLQICKDNSQPVAPLASASSRKQLLPAKLVPTITPTVKPIADAKPTRVPYPTTIKKDVGAELKDVVPITSTPTIIVPPPPSTPITSAFSTNTATSPANLHTASSLVSRPASKVLFASRAQGIPQISPKTNNTTPYISVQSPRFAKPVTSSPAVQTINATNATPMIPQSSVQVGSVRKIIPVTRKTIGTERKPQPIGAIKRNVSYGRSNGVKMMTIQQPTTTVSASAGSGQFLNALQTPQDLNKVQMIKGKVNPSINLPVGGQNLKDMKFVPVSAANDAFKNVIGRNQQRIQIISTSADGSKKAGIQSDDALKNLIGRNQEDIQIISTNVDGSKGTGIQSGQANKFYLTLANGNIGSVVGSGTNPQGQSTHIVATQALGTNPQGQQVHRIITPGGSGVISKNQLSQEEKQQPKYIFLKPGPNIRPQGGTLPNPQFISMTQASSLNNVRLTGVTSMASHTPPSNQFVTMTQASSLNNVRFTGVTTMASHTPPIPQQRMPARIISPASTVTSPAVRPTLTSAASCSGQPQTKLGSTNNATSVLRTQGLQVVRLPANIQSLLQKQHLIGQQTISVGGKKFYVLKEGQKLIPSQLQGFEVTSAAGTASVQNVNVSDPVAKKYDPQPSSSASAQMQEIKTGEECTIVLSGPANMQLGGASQPPNVAKTEKTGAEAKSAFSGTSTSVESGNLGLKGGGFPCDIYTQLFSTFSWRESRLKLKGGNGDITIPVDAMQSDEINSTTAEAESMDFDEESGIPVESNPSEGETPNMDRDQTQDTDQDGNANVKISNEMDVAARAVLSILPPPEENQISSKPEAVLNPVTVEACNNLNTEVESKETFKVKVEPGSSTIPTGIVLPTRHPCVSLEIESSRSDGQWMDVAYTSSNQYALTSYFAVSGKLHKYKMDSDLSKDMEFIKRKTELEAGSVYKFRVAAVNSLGIGPWSEVSTFKTCIEGHPTAPGNVKIAKRDGGVLLSWDSPSTSDNKIVEYSVFLAIKPKAIPDQPQASNSLSFVRIYSGPANECLVKYPHLGIAHVDISGTKPALIFRVSAKNSSGYGPATQVRWVQDTAFPNFGKGNNRMKQN